MLLLPAYKLKLKREQPAVSEVQCWSAEHESELQDCFDTTDWSVFKDSSVELDEYADLVTDYIRSCMDLCVPSHTV